MAGKEGTTVSDAIFIFAENEAMRPQPDDVVSGNFELRCSACCMCIRAQWRHQDFGRGR